MNPMHQNGSNGSATLDRLGLRAGYSWGPSFPDPFDPSDPFYDPLSLELWPDTDGNFEPGNTRWVERAKRRAWRSSSELGIATVIGGELLHAAALGQVLATKRATPPGGTSRHKPPRAPGASPGLFQRDLTSPPTAACPGGAR